MWLVFAAPLAVLPALDLGVLHKDDPAIGVRESLWLSAGYVGVAVLFGVWVSWALGAQSSVEYFSGFFIERSLSMDNVFVIALIFSYFVIRREYQYRVLFWGVLGLIVLRALMTAFGAAPVTQFSWALYFALVAMNQRFKVLNFAFALVLVFIGLKIFLVGIVGKMPPAMSVSVTFGLVAAGVAVSMGKTRHDLPALQRPLWRMQSCLDPASCFSPSASWRVR